MRGEALAQGSGFGLSLGRTTVTPLETAAFRVDRGLSTTVGVYRGAAELSALGNPVQVDALWQAVVVANAVPTDPSPLVVRPTDPWDQQMLGSAIDVGLRLRRIELGVRGQLDRRVKAAKLVADALPDPMAPKRVRGLIREHAARPGTVFVALALATQSSAQGGVLRTASPASSTASRLGASWIVVVAALDVARPNLLTAIGRILAAIPGLIDPTSIGDDPTGGPGPDPDPGDPDPPGGCQGSDCPTPPDHRPSSLPRGRRRVRGAGGRGPGPRRPPGRSRAQRAVAVTHSHAASRRADLSPAVPAPSARSMGLRYAADNVPGSSHAASEAAMAGAHDRGRGRAP